MGAGLSYGSSATAGPGRSANDFKTLRAPGNRFGNPPLVWPDFTPNYPLEVAPGVRPPIQPFFHVDRHAGRPPRIFQWSIGLQREITQNLVIEAAYVGNRGAWWNAPVLSLE